MTNIFMSGCCGRMGRAIYNMTKNSENFRIVAGSDLSDNTEGLDFPVYKDIFDCKEDFDAIIDFSHFKAVPNVCKYAIEHKKALVLCTTALDEPALAAAEELSKVAPLFKSANMSVGMNVVFELAAQAAKALYPDFDIEIVEAHHNRKLDAPSGTAFQLGEAIKSAIPDEMEYVYDRHNRSEARHKNEIGMSAIRGGNIVGEHEVYFVSDEETIKITHQCMTREAFARGALAAAEYIKDKGPGRYSMKDVVSKAFN